MSRENKYTLRVEDHDDIVIDIPEGVFMPTGTTTGIIKALKRSIRNPGKLLDLGCGCGVIGMALYKMGLATPPIFASDMSKKAVECLKKNARLQGVPVTVKRGSLFTPWVKEKFDYIANDVAGISEKIAGFSPWYNDVPCKAGADGTRLVNQVIKKAPEHLNDKGIFFFPIVSLSNEKKIMETACKNFARVEKLIHDEWPLPKEMYVHMPMLKRLRKRGYVNYTEKFGMVLCFTDVYAAYDY